MSYRDNILTAILNMNPGSIYYMSLPAYVKRGFEYYAAGRVYAIEWKAPSLVAWVRGTALYRVEITATPGGGLDASCDCPAFEPGTPCKHVICAFMTLKNLLEPRAFSTGKKRTKKELSLLAALGIREERPEKEGRLKNGRGKKREAKKQKTDTPCLIIQPDQENPLYIEYRGRRFSYFYPEDVLPYKYLDIVKKFYYKTYKRTDLKTLRIPVLFKKDRKKEIRFDNSLRYRTFTAVDVGRKKLLVSRQVRCKKDISGESVVADRLVVHPPENSFGLVDDFSGWKFFSLITNCRIRGSTKEIPSDSIIIAEKDTGILNDVVFTSNGQETAKEETAPSYLINARIRNNGRRNVAEITPRVKIGGRFLETNPHLLEPLKTAASGGMKPLRSYQQRETVLNAIWMMKRGMTNNKMDVLIRETLRDIPANRKERQRLRSFLKDLSGLYMKNYIYLVFRNGKVFSASFEPERELIAWRILQESFGPVFFRHFGIPLLIPLEEFEARLSSLYAAASEKGIDLMLEDRPVRVSGWDINLSLKRSDIDWFELHPEIRANGRNISGKIWKSIIEGKKGYILSDDAVEVMDDVTAERLKHLVKTINLHKERTSEGVLKTPRLQILDWIELRKKGIKVKLPPEAERVITSLLNFRGIKPHPLPSGLRAKLRGYQKEGYHWLCFLYEHRLGACLADDMGLGKTIQAISLIAAAKEGLLKGAPKGSPPNLIVVPPSILFNWESELNRFYPDMKVYLYTGKERRPDFGKYDIVLTSYGIVRRDITELREKRFHVIIFDEAQAVKNIRAATTAAVRGLNARFRLALTGTPIENNLGEYYSIIDLVLPGLLGKETDFRRFIKKQDEDILNIIIKRTAPFVLRRTKEEVLKDLPPKIETNIYLDLTADQKTLYEKTVKLVKKEVNDAYETKPEAGFTGRNHSADRPPEAEADMPLAPPRL
jgi:non-specific serine/threonine protein kinase